jgi:serine phosphatase RsbU (regulator of sigma subunit)
VVAFLVTLLLFPASSQAQEGGLMLTHFSESRQAEDQNWAICQDSRNIMLFANRRGVFTFDGYEWNLEYLPVIPYTMVYNANDERVYIGGEDGYGYMSRDGNGIYRYTPIETDSLFSGVVTGIVFTDSAYYFMTASCIAAHSPSTMQQTLFMTTSGDKPFAGLISAPSGIYVSVYSQGLCRMEGSDLIPLITGYMTAYDDILFSLPYDSRYVMLGLGSGTIHLFDGLEFLDWEPADEGYISQKLLSGGHLVNDTLCLFSTVEGGVVVAGRKSRKVYHVINYETGLPDDEVFAIGSDNSSGLWISHEYGLSRADLSLPVRNFGIYQGLKGNLISSLMFNDTLYVASSDGLFILKEVPRYEQFDIYRKVAVRRQAVPVAEALPAERVIIPDIQVIEDSRRTIFNRIFGKRTTVTTDAAVATPERVEEVSQQTIIAEPEPPAYSYVKRTVSRLKSLHHEFSRVEELTDKCKQMVPTPNGLLAATNRGIWLIKGAKAYPIVKGRYVNRIGSRTANGSYYVATANGYFSLRYSNGKWITESPSVELNQPVYSTVIDNNGALWLGLDNKALKITREQTMEPVITEFSVPADYIQRYHLELMRDTVFLLAESGLYYLDQNADSLLPVKYSSYFSEGTRSFILTENGNPIIVSSGIPYSLGSAFNGGDEDQSILRLFEKISSVTMSDKTLWITDAMNRVFRVEPFKAKELQQPLGLYIGGRSGSTRPFFDIERAEFADGDGVVRFKLVAPWYINQGAVQYQYQYLGRGVSQSWSDWSSEAGIYLPEKPGVYILRVRARAITGVSSEIRELQFRVKPKFTETEWFYLLIFSVLTLSIFLLVRFREKKLIMDKMLLEEKVLERTAKIEAQKHEITSSIEYASRIQHAMLPADSIFRSNFSDYFILFRPRDIVSGDFYWFAEESGRVFFTAADCTGHGVPGAFMSMLGISSLNEIITSDATPSAAEVLDLLRERVIRSLKQTGRQGEAADGIDMALCIFDKVSSTIEFAAAYNSMLHFRGAKITEYRGNRMPIGIFYGEDLNFTNHVVKLNRGDTVYLFTDGFADQFGGPDNGKYKVKNLKLLLSSVKDLPMIEQKRLIEEEFERWRGPNEQVDDITILGIRF